MNLAVSRNRTGRAIHSYLRFRSQFFHVRNAQTRAHKKTDPVEPPTTQADSVNQKQGWFSSFRRKKEDPDWIHGPETIILHTPKLHVFHHVTAIFPAFAILVALYNMDTIWNHGLIENPKYNRFDPKPEQPLYIRKPVGERLTYVSLTAASCAVTIGCISLLRRRVIRTISFRTDQPRQRVTGNSATARALRSGQGLRMVSFTSVSGSRSSYPLQDLELGNAKKEDTLLVKAPRQILPFLIEVDQANIGWPGITTMFGPFQRNLKEDKKVTQEKEAMHNRHAKQLFGLLWKTHMGVDLPRKRIVNPWTKQ